VEPIPLSGVHHVALNVRDVAASERWYAKVLGFRRVQDYRTDDFDRVVLRHPSGVVLALGRHRHAEADDPYSHRRPGLDHLAFGVATGAELRAWATHLDRLGVEHGAITPGRIPGAALLAFRDPDGIQLEIYALPR
jgi:glyoxylase I family protein